MLVQVSIYYNYLSSLETAPTNIMLPYYFLSYGLCMESHGWRVQSTNEHHSHIREITCPLYAPAKRKEQGQKFTQNN